MHRTVGWLFQDDGHRRQQPHTHSVVVRVGHIETAAGVHGDAGRTEEADRRSRSIGTPARTSQAGHRAHRTGRRHHLSDREIVGVRHIDVSGQVHGHVRWRIESSSTARAVRTAGTARQAGQGADQSRGGDGPDGMILSVCNVEGARAVDRHTGRESEARNAAGPVRAPGVPSQTGNGRHGPG